MTAQQWIRRGELLVGSTNGNALDLSQLRFRFHVQRSGLQTPNTCEIYVYNVSDQTASQIKNEFSRVVLSAGYENGYFGTIFDGQIKYVRKGRENQTDTFVAIQAADSDHAYNFGVVNTSLTAGSTHNDHIQAAVGAMGATKGYMPELLSVPLPRGKVMYGMARDYLRDTARSTGNNWSFQDGKLEFAPIDGYIPDTEAIVVNRNTGIIGQPEQTPNGIVVKALLNPNFKAERRVKLDNASIQRAPIGLDIQSQAEAQLIMQGLNQYTINADGIYVIKGISHSGDTRGQQWYTDMVCIAIDGTVPMGLVNKGY